MEKTNDRLTFPATFRNRVAILEVLKLYIPKSGMLLEIGSGSGEHGVFFKTLFPPLFGKQVTQNYHIEKLLKLGFLNLNWPRECLNH
tara:strand:+ start:51 stop:311 length:261 start_codon:yes stop_codon:yes gene_type:complete